jgi:hypothetical protein
MSINPDRLNDFNSKSYDTMDYVDYSRYKNFKKINIDYTFSDNNEVITSGPVFNSSKIVENRIPGAYTNKQEPYASDSLKKMRMVREYNKIRQ